MQRIAVQQKVRKHLFLNKHFTPGIPKEPEDFWKFTQALGRGFSRACGA